MKVREAWGLARRWVDETGRKRRGFMGAHLVGSVASMAPDDEFPPYRDVDLHIVLRDGSPGLNGSGFGSGNIEVPYEGLMIEAGVKPARMYASPDAVLSNPEIADHLRSTHTILADPAGLLRVLQREVKEHFAESRWVSARLDHERQGLEAAMALLPMAREMGPSGEVELLGYSFTFASAAMAVATLRPVSTGSRSSLRLRDALAEAGTPGVYQDILQALGVASATRRSTEGYMAECLKAFDVACGIRGVPHPFGHKLHPHLRPYVAGACESLIAEGHFAEATWWLTPFYLASTDLITMDGETAEHRQFATRAKRFLEALGLLSREEREAAFARAEAIQKRIFALATIEIGKLVA